MAKHYFLFLSSDSRLLIARYLLENREKQDVFNLTSIQVMFHPFLPFAHELILLFPTMGIDSHGVRSKEMLLYRLHDDWTRSDTLELIGKCLVEVRTQGLHPPIPNLLKPYCSNLNRSSISLQRDIGFPWYELVKVVSQSLEELTLYGIDTSITGQLSSITEKFPNLKSLALYRFLCSQLSPWPELVNQLLQTFGETVQSLNLGYDKWNDEANVLDEHHLCRILQSHCPNITDLEQLRRFISPSGYEILLQYYGHQAARICPPVDGHCNSIATDWAIPISIS